MIFDVLLTLVAVLSGQRAARGAAGQVNARHLGQ